MKIVGVDVGSTTVKALVVEDGRTCWRDYQRHNTRQAEKVLEFLTRMEADCGLAAGRDRVFFTGSGAGFLAPLVGGKLIQEVVAVAAAVERLHPEVRFVSEIGGEDMKTVFFTPTGSGKSKQVYMQSACSGGTGTFIEKTARKLQIPPDELARMGYAGRSLHKISSKCGIFAEADANTLVKAGVPVEEIIASLFEAVVYQNLATLTKGNTPMPEVLLLGGPNLFLQGLQEAWRHHLKALWSQRRVPLPEGRDPDALIQVPSDALYYACLGCVEIGAQEAEGVGVYRGTDRLRWWIEVGQHEQKAKEGARGLVAGESELEQFLARYGGGRAVASLGTSAAVAAWGTGGVPGGLIQLRGAATGGRSGSAEAPRGSGGPAVQLGGRPAVQVEDGPAATASAGSGAERDGRVTVAAGGASAATAGGAPAGRANGAAATAGVASAATVVGAAAVNGSSPLRAGAAAFRAGGNGAAALQGEAPRAGATAAATALVGCDFGSTTAKAVVLSPEKEPIFSCYVLSRGNPIEDAKALFRQIRQAGFHRVGALALTGYGKDLLKDIVGADVAVVETVAHATAALHFFPDADVICDVGGCDVKIMLLRQGTVADFRLNSQCSSGNGAFLQGVAERYGVALEQYAERAFQAKAMPTLTMGCGVFLQSDIVNQQRKGWSAEEIMASLAAVLPLNVWIYAGQLQNLRAAGRKFVLQGGTHRNLAVVKAQVDFITSKVPDAEIVVHPYSGEAGAIGAALCAFEAWQRGEPSRFRGFDVIESLTYTSTTSEETVCHWCPCNCKRTFIDVRLPDGKGRPWSKVPLGEGWERVISGNSCPKGLVEDVNEMRVVKAKLEEVKRAYPNVAELVRKEAFRRARASA